ncbi:ABC transporter ATP-binding protein [Suicoccus acidiformans]|uniref:ABC-type quaternary amine transporter n=1 Tax=Suicoccus acidiformans TaxID=2036206 RepID=A0A347WNS2_9LACT|nr:ABC transporter ATP-binding protein [Suicoccus acidiformans]AXY26729.1 ABC transporter ATP-binding protein [Suicoccus acidiformans]
MTTKLQIEQLTKKFNKNDGIENINLDIQDKELVTLLGPSGCGKTTILRSVGGFHEIDSGKIILDGQEIQDFPPEKRATGMVFQGYNLWPHMTVFENMEYGLKLRKIDKKKRREKIEKALELVRMPEHINKFPSQLSGGQQQRVAIARSLVLEPSLLLLDEPFSALDAKIRQHMREELKRIQDDANLTILFVTHDQEEAMFISDRIIVMNKGNIEQIGGPNDIYDRPNTRFVAEFIGDMNIFSEQDVTYGVRPENIRITKSIEGGYVVQQMMSLGHYSQVILAESNTQEEVKVFVNRDMEIDYVIGDTVDITIQDKINFTV